MPPGAFRGIGVLFSIGLVDEVAPLLAVGYHTVDGAPVGKTTEVAVVDKEVGL